MQNRVLQNRVLQGRVLDARTGAPLPGTVVAVEGRPRRTTAGPDGRFRLPVTRLPASLTARRVGYNPGRRVVRAGASDRPVLRLSPAAPSPDTAREGRAEAIMRRVLTQKASWAPALRSYRADAYVRRRTVRPEPPPTDSLVFLREAWLEGTWHRTRPPDTTVHARRASAAAAHASVRRLARRPVVNLYRDTVHLGRSRLIGVTHPRALDYYRFSLADVTVRGGHRVYRLRVRPTDERALAFRGTIAVRDSAFAMVEADLRPTRPFRLSRPLAEATTRVRQQFVEVEGRYWLPLDVRRTSTAEVALPLTSTVLRERVVVQLSGHRVAAPRPDTTRAAAASAPGPAPADGERPPPTDEAPPPSGSAPPGAAERPPHHPYVPLRPADRRVYARQDSATVAAATRAGWVRRTARTAVGLLAPHPIGTVRGHPVRLTMYPRAWYNRVQSVYGGLWGRLHVGPAPPRRFGLTLRGKGGYNSGLRSPSPWTYGGAVTIRRYAPWGTSVQVGFAREVRPQYGLGHRYETAVTSDVSLPLLQNGLLMVTGTPDYYDYVGSRGLQAVVTQRAPLWHARLHLRYLDQAQFAVPSVTSYDLLGRRTGLTPNPLVDPGRLRAVGTQLTLSADTAAYSDHPRRTITLDVEHSTARLRSDFDYTRFRVSLGAEWPTFFRHRFAPNVLRLRAEAGTTLGTVSLQRLGVVSASAPQPRLHTINRPYRGERHASFFWAHNFRTVPFEWLGLQGLADRNYEVTLFGGHAATGLHSARPPADRRRLEGVTTDGLHHEIGLALDGLQGLFRFTAAKRLDGRAFSVGLGLSSLSSLRP